MLFKACVRKFYCFLIALAAAAALVLGFVGFKVYLRPAYVTDAVVLFLPGGSDNEAYQKNGEIDVSYLSSLSLNAGSYVSLANNRWVVSRALDELELQVDDMDAFMGDNISVSNILSSPYVSISVEYPDAETSYQLTKKIIDLLPVIAEDLNIKTSVSVVSFPVMPVSPDLPSTKILVLAGTVLGLFGGFVCILFQELFYRSFHTSKDVRREMQAETIGWLPRQDISKDRREGRKRGAEQAFALMAANIMTYGLQVIAFVSDSRALWQWEIEKIAARLQGTGRQVLLIDFRKHAARRSAPGSTGSFSYTNLYSEEASLTPCLYREKVEQLLAESRQKFDYILFYSMPLDERALAMGCLQQAELMVFLLRHKHTTWDWAKVALSALNRLKPGIRVCAALAGMQWKGILSDFKEAAKQTGGYAQSL
ncbi:MAG TPA: hypothetical protein VN366_12075 [Feifaniaceae bacterium]|nr:hypothetical protein [Feifaniaceae bacterium]